MLEGPVPEWKKFGQRGDKAQSSARGASRGGFGLPRFDQASFNARFPYGLVSLHDQDLPLSVDIKGWSPFIPSNEGDSSLPVGAFEYTLANKSRGTVDGVFSWNAKNFMRTGKGNKIRATEHGFILEQASGKKSHVDNGAFAAVALEDSTRVDHSWFRGKWYDSLSMAWKKLESGDTTPTPPLQEGAPGASLYVPFALRAGEQKTIRVLFAWYVPNTNLRTGKKADCGSGKKSCAREDTHQPRFSRGGRRSAGWDHESVP